MSSRARLRTTLRTVVALAVLATAAAAGSADTARAAPLVYVALGDSFTAGPLIPLQEQPFGCFKSTNNYPKLLAGRFGFVLRDASCSGARTRHMTESQGVWPEPNPPQFSRLDADVDLVTLQIGGNDIGFSDIAETCTRAALEGRTCQEQYGDGDGDELRERIAATAPKVAAAVQAIREQAPAARLLVLGYPGIFRIPPDEPAGCPAMGVGESDALYLRGVHEALNEMLAQEAAANGATYVDVYTPSRGMTACDLPVTRWVEPVVPAHAAAPIHPNLMGMIGVADVLAAAIGGPG